jgi:hypothetical protein
MGGHRFFTKAKALNKLWWEVLGDEFLKRPRESRNLLQRQILRIPAETDERAHGPSGSCKRDGDPELHPLAGVPASAGRVSRAVGDQPVGRRSSAPSSSLYRKVWGTLLFRAKAEWAAQRIKDLSLKSAVLSMFFKPRKRPLRR